MSFKILVSRLSSLYSPGEARAIVRLLLESRFSLSWTDILCGAIDKLNARQQEELETMMRRLEKSEPVQYVLGETEFCGHIFHVEPGVLIPRPETEELVAEVVKAAESMAEHQNIKVIDIGTGSGCIAISIALALHNRQGEVSALDISDEALRIASGNAEKLCAKHIQFKKVDILDNNQTSTLPADYSIIVSNPPYICNKERAEMEQNVLSYEPALALFVPDEDPLLFYRAIADFATDHLQKGGRLFFEINRAYGSETADLLKHCGFVDVQIINDQFDNPRIVTGTL